MRFACYLFFFLLFSFNSSFAQVINEDPNSPVYDYLKRASVSGFLPEYNDVVLPLSKSKIHHLLSLILEKKSFLSSIDIEKLERYHDYYQNADSSDSVKSLFGYPESSVIENIGSDSENHLYQYRDENFYFTINPVFSSRLIINKTESRDISTSQLFSYGADFSLVYNNFLGIYLRGTNGVQFGDRETAKLDRRVAQSFTFNKTGLNFFDHTEGYIQLQNDFITLQAGRERIHWGTGFINRVMLDETPPMFDFIRLNLSYKKFYYDFIHGWLVEKPQNVTLDTLGNYGRTKIPKYVAISRLGFKPSNNVDLGITQAVIYCNRPFELSYLNPFLVWESAQRSLNDLDNSFLGFDARVLVTNGVLLNGSILFDDLNFSNWFKGDWEIRNNGLAIQTGMHLTHPVLPDFLEFKIEYLQVRPYMFSHQGFETGLAYTNNGYPLGTEIQPNSFLISASLDFHLGSRLLLGLQFDYKKHGRNLIDSTGNVIKNVGGDIFHSHSAISEFYAYLMDGDIEKEYLVHCNIEYELSYNVNFSLNTLYRKYIAEGVNTDQVLFNFTVNYNTRLLKF